MRFDLLLHFKCFIIAFYPRQVCYKRGIPYEAGIQNDGRWHARVSLPARKVCYNSLSRCCIRVIYINIFMLCAHDLDRWNITFAENTKWRRKYCHQACSYLYLHMYHSVSKTVLALIGLSSFTVFKAQIFITQQFFAQKSYNSILFCCPMWFYGRLSALPLHSTS